MSVDIVFYENAFVTHIADRIKHANMWIFLYLFNI